MLSIGVLLSAVAYTQGCTVNYVEPTFQLTKEDPGCSPGSGRIEVINQQGGVGPFSYKLVETNTTNSTGIFTGLPAGAYSVISTDACGTIRARQVTLVPYDFSFTYKIDRLSDCNDGQISMDVMPGNGTFEYGVVYRPGDTLWSASPTFDLILKEELTIVVKDACGNIKYQYWKATPGFLPYIAELQHRLQCDKFDLFPIFYGFKDATVCLYSYPSNKLIGCKTGDVGPAVNFYDVPWGDYYVIVEDACFRDSAFYPDQRSAGGSELNPYNWDCNTFTMHVDGLEDTVCLYDAVSNKLISCLGQDTVSINPRTGVPWPSGAVWENLPYGSYYAWIYDPCMDSTFRIDSTVSYPFTMDVAAYANCSFTQSAIGVNFDPGTKAPYHMRILYPDGTLALNTTTSQTSNYLVFNTYTGGGQMTVIAEDGCGNSDTTKINQSAYELNRDVEVKAKCPGVIGTSGSGDILIHCTFSDAGMKPIPAIIKKDGKDTTIAYASYDFSSNTHNYLFPNLLSGIYIVKYTSERCGATIAKLDTIVIKDYTYPTQPVLNVQQCYINQFTFRDSVTGGLAPFTYEIIGNSPAYPSLINGIQSSPVFTINTGTAYDSIRVRAVDFCGNSSIGDVLVKPTVGCDFVLPVDTSAGQAGHKNKLAKVYPNPSNGRFTISISQKKKTNYRIEIANALGIKIYETVLKEVDRKDHIINERLIPGLYIVTIYDMNTGQLSTFKQIVR